MIKILLLLTVGCISAYAGPAVAVVAGLGSAAAGLTIGSLGVAATAAVVGGSVLAASMLQESAADRAADANAASEAARLKAEQDARNRLQIGEQQGLGAVKEKTGGTLGDTEVEDARAMVRKKRLGTTALRIDPLTDTGTSTPTTGLSSTNTTGLKI